MFTHLQQYRSSCFLSLLCICFVVKPGSILTLGQTKFTFTLTTLVLVYIYYVCKVNAPTALLLLLLLHANGERKNEKGLGRVKDEAREQEVACPHANNNNKEDYFVTVF